jgi:hypothetical protein
MNELSKTREKIENDSKKRIAYFRLKKRNR